MMTQPNPMWVTRSLLLVAPLMLSACGGALRSDWHPPETPLPAQWQMQSSQPAVSKSPAKNPLSIDVMTVGGAWWRQFNDAQLNALVEQALKENNDLAAAALRVQQARLRAGLADTNLVPDVAVSGSSSLQRDFTHSSNTRHFNASAAVSYELDLWGRLSAVRDIAHWEAQATEQDKQAAALALVRTTAELFWQIAALHQRLHLREASIAYLEQMLTLAQARYHAGKVSRLDSVQAQQNLAAQQAIHTQLLQQLAQSRHAMALLFNQPPNYRVVERDALPMTALPKLDPGLPATLLHRRPDLYAAEMRLRKSLAQVDEVRTSYLPKLTLNTALNSASDALLKVLSNPVGTLGAGLTLPFIQWNTRTLNIDISESQYQEAIVNFRQTLYKALAEVEDGLSARGYYQTEAGYVEHSLSLAQEVESLNKARYQAGKTDMQSWLDQQNNVRQVEESLIENRLNQLNNMAKLYQALGGKHTMQRNRVRLEVPLKVIARH